MAFPTTYINSKGQTTPFPRPQKPIPEGLKTNTLVQTFDAGNEQRRRKSDPRRAFDITYPLLEKEAYERLQSFFLEMGGSLSSFEWTHPVTKTPFNVRFDQDQLMGEYFLTTVGSRHYWKCSFKLLQVL